MIVRRLHLLCGSFFLVVGFLDFLNRPTFNNRHRQLLTDISSHRGYGTHYVTLMVGNPPQLLRLAVSTGSDYTAFPCQGCYTCHEPHFQYSAESVHQCPNECLFEDSMCQDGKDGCRITVQQNAVDDLGGAGYKGVEVTADAYADVSPEIMEYHPDIAAKEGFPLHFICQEDALGDTIPSNGYLGMSTAKLSYVNQLYDAGKIQHRMFSLCFQDYDNYQPSGASAGHVTFGHVDKDLLDSQLLWAANTASSESLSNYAVHIRRVYLGVGGAPNYLKSASMGTMTMVPIGKLGSGGAEYATMNGKSGAVLIQTNQPTTYLHSSMERAFQAEFLKITGMHYTVPVFKMTEQQFDRLPTVFIQIEANRVSQGNSIAADLIPGFAGRHDHDHPYDILLAVSPEHYIIHLDGLAFPTLRFGPTPRIASNILQNHELVFDLDHNRIGFAERKHCPEGMSMMTALTPRSPHNIDSGPQARVADASGSQEGEQKMSDGKNFLPEDRDFVVVSSDAAFSTSTAVNDNQITPGGSQDTPLNGNSPIVREVDGSGGVARPVEGVSSEGDNLADSEVHAPVAVNENEIVPEVTQGTPPSRGHSEGRTIGGSSGATQTTDLNNQDDGSSPSGGGNIDENRAGEATTSGSGNGIHGELDGSGASNAVLGDGAARGARGRGRTFGGSNNESNSQAGESNGQTGSSTQTGDPPTLLVEPQDGLPSAQTEGAVQAPRIGPGAISSGEAFGGNRHVPRESPYNEMNLLGFFLFIAGFSVTVYFTRDNVGSGVYAYFSPSKSQTGDNSNAAEPLTNNSGLNFMKQKSFKMMKQQSSKLKKGISSRNWFGAGSDDDSGSSRYSGEQSHAGDDQSGFTGAERSERPYYDDRRRSDRNLSDQSGGSFYQAYSQSGDTMNGSSSISGSRQEDSPYYDASYSQPHDPSKSSRSIHSQGDEFYDEPDQSRGGDYNDAQYSAPRDEPEQSRGGDYNDAQYSASRSEIFHDEPSYEGDSRDFNGEEVTRATTMAPANDTMRDYDDEGYASTRGAGTMMEGDSYSGVESFSDDVHTDLPSREEVMQYHHDVDDYSDVESFYVDEV